MISLTIKEDLRRIFRFLPREVVRADSRLHLTADRMLVKKAIGCFKIANYNAKTNRLSSLLIEDYTAEVPPNHGRVILAITGCTSNSRKGDQKMVTE
jgi:hypothetical protein